MMVVNDDDEVTSGSPYTSRSWQVADKYALFILFWISLNSGLVFTLFNSNVTCMNSCFISCVSGGHNRIDPACVHLFVWVCENYIAQWVQDYVVRHWSALCTTNLRCTPLCTRGTYVRQKLLNNTCIASYWLGGAQDSFSCTLWTPPRWCTMRCCQSSWAW